MIIKNVLINGNIDLYLNTLIKELIKNNINFLYIKESMELHFDNYILSFYTPEIILNELNKALKDSNDILSIFENLESYMVDDDIYCIIDEPKQYINQKKIINVENKKNNEIIKKQLKHTIKIHRNNKKPKKY